MDLGAEDVIGCCLQVSIERFKADAIMPIRKQAIATITISRMTTCAGLFRLLAIRDGPAKALELLRKLVAVGEPQPTALHFQKVLA
jgi:hypothetical protein